VRATKVVDWAGVTRKLWNDATRTYFEYDAAGAQTLTRAYTTAENAEADAEALEVAARANGSTIDTNLAADLVTLQAMIDATNATINASPASYIKDLARVQRRIVRRVIGKLDGTT
jgi:paraquat-inducible protein B